MDRTALVRIAYRLLDGAAARSAWLSQFSVKWFSSWGPVLDQALAQLPPLDTCPHDRYRALAANPTAAEKRHAVVRLHGQPVAVVSLRRRMKFWEPVTEQCVPGSAFPTAPEIAPSDVLRAVGLEVHLSGLDADHSVDPLKATSCTPYTTYQASLRGDFESHWREAGRMNSVKQARRRTVGCVVRVDHPGDVEWNIRTWAEIWKDDSAQQALQAEDRLCVWPQLSAEGRLHTVTLVDSADPVAGAVFYAHRGRLLFLCTARDRTRGHQAVGTRVLDESFHWAAQAGFEEMDLGGGLDYKRWWAPAGQTRYHVVFRSKVYEPATRVVKLVGQMTRNSGP